MSAFSGPQTETGENMHTHRARKRREAQERNADLSPDSPKRRRIRLQAQRLDHKNHHHKEQP